MRGGSATYRASFPSGFRPLVERLIQRDFGDSIDKNPLVGGDESTIVFHAPFPTIIPAYLQTMSLVLDSVPTRNIGEAYRHFASRASSEGVIKNLALAASSSIYAGSKKGARFALRGFVRGEPHSVPAEARRALERAIQDATGFRPDSARANLELQVTLRDDGSSYFLATARLERMDGREKGTLPTSTARLLCELSQPSADDVFLDPFMGSGAIPIERAKWGPYGMIFVGDIDEARVAAFKEKLKTPPLARRRRTIFPKTLDARDLSRFEEDFFSVIVTDPPWGIFEGIDEQDLLSLYAAFLGEAHRVLRGDGRLVLLTGRDAPLDGAIAMAGAPWSIEEDYGVLVSGRKARALRLSRASVERERKTVRE